VKTIAPLKNATRFFAEFARLQSSSGTILLLCAAAAFAWANSPWAESYHALWKLPLGLSWGRTSAQAPLLLWINDGLMTLFFFVVGLEIKRELLRGELSTRQKAVLPIAAAIGGMIVPALIYISFNSGTAAAAGWGIPVATDIAFSLGILSLARSSVPFALKVFLTAFAIVDDLGAVAVIAIFYTSGLALTSLIMVGLLLAAMMIANRCGIRRPWVFIALAIAVWIAMLTSGVHATIAGVLAALTIPLEPSKGLTGASEGGSMLESMERALHPWVTFVVMPVFALANAGVTLERNMASAILNPVTLGIMIGLVCGKFIGLMFTSWATVRLRVAELPKESGWSQMAAVSMLGGVGFTMSLFIAGLAFDDPMLLADAKVGILGGSLVAGIVGWGILSLIGERKSS
jgi:NhaA family Na+:H+ antiporter